MYFRAFASLRPHQINGKDGILPPSKYYEKTMDHVQPSAFFTVVHRKCISKMYYRCWSLRFFLHQLCCLLFGSFVRYKWFRSIFKLYTCSSLNRLLIFLPLSFGCLPFSSWLYHIPIITSYLFIYFCYLFVVIFMPWQSVLHSADSDACRSHFSLALPVNFKLSYLFAICS